MTAKSVRPIPEGMHSVTPHLICAGAAEAIDFYKKAFGATEMSRLPGPNGKLMHGSIRIGDSTVMLADEMREWGALGPKALNGSSVVIHLYVEDVDAFTARAAAAGAKITMPVQDMFWVIDMASSRILSAIVGPSRPTFGMSAQSKCNRPCRRCARSADRGRRVGLRLYRQQPLEERPIAAVAAQDVCPLRTARSMSYCSAGVLTCAPFVAMTNGTASINLLGIPIGPDTVTAHWPQRCRAVDAPGFETPLEPRHSLRAGPMSEGLRHDHIAGALLQGVIADLRGGVQRGLDVARFEAPAPLLL